MLCVYMFIVITANLLWEKLLTFMVKRFDEKNRCPCSVKFEKLMSKKRGLYKTLQPSIAQTLQVCLTDPKGRSSAAVGMTSSN